MSSEVPDFRPQFEITSTAAAFNAARRMMDALRPPFDLQQFPFLELARPYIQLAQSCERFTKQVRDKAEQLGALGWTVPLDTTLSDTLDLLERSTSAEAADATFTEFYAADGGAACTSLKENLLSQTDIAPWREDLSTACARLADDDYRSCVNNLLPVMDGFATAKLREPRFHNKGARDRFFARKVDGETSLLNQALWLSVKAFVARLFEQIDFGDQAKLSERLNRHARLHGRGAYRPTRADCFRLLQALHTISYL
ncbi:MAG: hypothetical protein IVW54_22680 [Candidatus Binataceae bacterium]|nr:hypothetical protein [Candidatus Binataceae bacterium]